MTTTTFSNTGVGAMTVKGRFSALWRWLVPLMLAAFLLGGVQGVVQAAPADANTAIETNISDVNNLSFVADASNNPMNTMFDKLTAFLKDFAKFMTGPVGLAVMMTSIVVAFATWSFAPKNGIFGPVLRVMASGIVIVNSGALIASFSGFV